jgi:hypothetical protein
MTDGPLRTERYQIAGEGRDLFTRLEVRDRIRNGSILAMTEVALEGSEEYKPALEYPELARYLSLVSNAPKAVEASSYVPAGSIATATSVGERLIPGLMYPLTGFGAAAVFGLALLRLLPPGFLAAAIAMPLVSVAIVRVGRMAAWGRLPVERAAPWGAARPRPIGVYICQLKRMP